MQFGAKAVADALRFREHLHEPRRKRARDCDSAIRRIHFGERQ
jgi:hypothetical protein